VAWTGSNTSAVGLLTVSAVPALAAARCAAQLAAATASNAIRTPDLALMGDGPGRLPRTSAALLLSALVVPLSLVAGASVFAQTPGPSLQGRGGLLFALGLALSALALARPAVALAYGPLRRRRAFEPERVREAAPAAAWSVLLLLGLAAVLADVAFLFTGWLAFLFGVPQAAPAVRTSVLWLLPVAVLVAGLVVFAGLKNRLLTWSAVAGARWEALVLLAFGYFDRYLEAPALGAVGAVDGPRMATGEGWLGLSLLGLGRDLRLLGRGAPALPLLFVLAIVVIVLAAAGLAMTGLPR
jgi:hypothetical protein